MNPHYNQNYTLGEIECILETIQECVKRGNFSISLNRFRQENIDFINAYKLTSTRQKEILLHIEPNDFCHSLNNTNPGYEYEVLYVFCPLVILPDLFGQDKQIDIYIKFNIIEYAQGQQVVTISFHERNKPIDYLFR